MASSGTNDSLGETGGAVAAAETAQQPFTEQTVDFRHTFRASGSPHSLGLMSKRQGETDADQRPNQLRKIRACAGVETDETLLRPRNNTELSEQRLEPNSI